MSMSKKQYIGAIGIIVSLGLMILMFQNCSNKDGINLDNAIAFKNGSSTALSIKDPIFISFSTDPSSNPLDVFSSGPAIYARVQNAGPNGRVCFELNHTNNCLTNYPSAWSDMYSNGWGALGSLTWEKHFTTGSSGELDVGYYRFYFSRPSSLNPNVSENYGSFDFEIQP